MEVRRLTKSPTESPEQTALDDAFDHFFRVLVIITALNCLLALMVTFRYFIEKQCECDICCCEFNCRCKKCRKRDDQKVCMKKKNVHDHDPGIPFH